MSVGLLGVVISGSIDGSISSSSGSLVQSSTGGSFVGQSFVQMVQRTSYREVVNVPSTYEVYIGKKGQLHRLLLVRMKDSDYPLITFEVNTPNMTDLRTVMNVIPELNSGCMEKVNDYSGTMNQLCEIADDVVTRMGSYRLMTNNCQHFCNNMLQELRMQTFKTTIGPIVTLYQSATDTDHHSAAYAVDTVCMVIANSSGVAGTALATAVGFAIGAPTLLNLAKAKRNKSK